MIYFFYEMEKMIMKEKRKRGRENRGDKIT
jgi:hypothetical protein